MALFLVLWPLAYSNAQTELDPSQTYSTGNIVVPTTTTSGSTWVGGVYQDGVNCMGGGGPGYCGPNPIVRPDGNINFSYGSVYLYQEQLTAGLLPSITGLQIRGYDFSFTAKNGNGWDDGRVDQLSALVRFWDTTTGKAANNLVYGNSWNLSYRFDWTNFTYSETFNSPYDANSIGRVQYGFIGKDNNFWAGHYGPEIRDVSFNIRYGVDPCASDPLYSPTCPGYLTALQSLVPAMAPTAEVVAAQPEPIAEVQPVATSAPATQQAASNQEQAQQQVAAVEQKQEQSNEKKEGASLSLVLSVVRQEQSRISSVEQSVVAESVSQAMKDADKTTAEAEAVAQQSSNQSQEQATLEQGGSQAQVAIASQTTTAQSAVSISNQTIRTGPVLSNQQFPINSDTQVTSIEQYANPVPINQVQDNTQHIPQGVIELKQPEPMRIDEVQIPAQAIAVDQRPITSQSVSSIPQQEASVPSLIPPTLIDPIRIETVIQEALPVNYSLIPERRIIEEIELPKMEEYKASATTPADDFMESKPPMIEAPQQNQSQTVKRNVQDNEAAAGVSLDRMAAQPAGYAQYSVALKDASFYEPKEIYRGQKVVDNAKALRQLATDKLHQEMIEQQYRR